MEVLKLLDKKEFKELLSICIGKVYSNQLKLKEFLGEYNNWNVDVDEGKLFIDDNQFDIEFIGTTSTSDDMWFNADLEKMIPQTYLEYLNEIYAIIENNNLEEILPNKIQLDDMHTGHAIATIYTALLNKNICYFNGSGDVSVFMFIKNLPDFIFEPINPDVFFDMVYDIIFENEINQRLMIKSFAINNGNEVEESDDKIVVKFSNGEEIEYEFDGDEMISADYKTNR